MELRSDKKESGCPPLAADQDLMSDPNKQSQAWSRIVKKAFQELMSDLTPSEEASDRSQISI